MRCVIGYRLDSSFFRSVQNPLGCLFTVAAFSKVFLEQYANVPEPELEFLEYRIPMYAQIFGMPFCDRHPYQAWWIDVDPVFRVKHPVKRAINSLTLRLNPNPLNPAKRKISLIPIGLHLSKRSGARIFHPYEKIFPLKKRQWFGALANEFRQDLNWLAQKLIKRE